MTLLKPDKIYYIEVNGAGKLGSPEDCGRFYSALSELQFTQDNSLPENHFLISNPSGSPITVIEAKTIEEAKTKYYTEVAEYIAKFPNDYQNAYIVPAEIEIPIVFFNNHYPDHQLLIQKIIIDETHHPQEIENPIVLKAFFTAHAFSKDSMARMVDAIIYLHGLDHDSLEAKTLLKIPNQMNS